VKNADFIARGKDLEWRERQPADQTSEVAGHRVGGAVNGRGVPPNDIEAGKWLRLAAAQGNTEARDKLAVLYRKGLLQTAQTLMDSNMLPTVSLPKLLPYRRTILRWKGADRRERVLGARAGGTGLARLHARRDTRQIQHVLGVIKSKR
jgi:hypothetical protein